MSSIYGVRTAGVLASQRAQSSLARRIVANAARRTALRQTATEASRSMIVPGFTRLSGQYGRYGRRAIQQGFKPELKFFDTSLSFNFDNTAEVPATGQLALIPQGDTESTRDGRLAYIKSIQIHGALQLSPGAEALADVLCYLYLVLDTQANGAAAAITDVFTTNAALTQLLNLNNSSRFRIIKRWVYHMEPKAGVSTAYNNNILPLDYYKRCNIKMDWSSTTGAITEIRSNNLFLCAGAAGTGSDDTVSFTGVCRLRFQG